MSGLRRAVKTQGKFLFIIVPIVTWIFGCYLLERFEHKKQNYTELHEKVGVLWDWYLKNQMPQ